MIKQVVTEFDIGLGDDIFMIGRLFNEYGKQLNQPTLRWGHISSMANQDVYHPTNKSSRQESFLVEIDAHWGHAGSPVFVRPFGIPELLFNQLKIPRSICKPWLLGIYWGNISSPDRAANTGISGVVPAWRLHALLNCDRAKAFRLKDQEQQVRNRSSSPRPVMV